MAIGILSHVLLNWVGEISLFRIHTWSRNRLVENLKTL
jgi:hypothetical protein